MNLKIDPALGHQALSPIYSGSRRIHIPGFLEKQAALHLGDMLKSCNWTQIYNIGHNVMELSETELDAMSLLERESINQGIQERATLGFQFRYRGIRIVADNCEFLLPTTDPLHTFGQFINHPDTLDFFRTLTGHHDIRWADAQATCYRPGDFLTGHDDAISGHTRRAAYVLNLTPIWRVEWGGLLLFHAADGHVDEGLAPSWNAINVFSVPQMHSVSQVAAFAGFPRLAITGWFHA